MNDWYMVNKLKLIVAEECCFLPAVLLHDAQAFARSTLVVVFSMTFEPATFTDALSSWALGEKWNYKGVEGMLQINTVTSTGRTCDDTPGLNDRAKHMLQESWGFFRKHADSMGHHSDAVVLALFRDTPCNGLEYPFHIRISPHELKDIVERARCMSATNLNASIEKHLLWVSCWLVIFTLLIHSNAMANLKGFQ